MSTLDSQQTIEVEADTLEEARELVKSKLPQGLVILSEQVISDGKPRTEKGMAESTEKAFAIAEAGLPPHSEILEKKEITPPDRKTILLEAPNEHEAENSARGQARQQLGGNASVESVKFIAAGRKGFLGIGEKPNQYQAIIKKAAGVEVRYKLKAKISVTVLPDEVCSSIRAEFIQLKQDKQINEAVSHEIVEKAARRGGDPAHNMAFALVGSVKSGEFDQKLYTYVVKLLAAKYDLTEDQIGKIVEPASSGQAQAEPVNSPARHPGHASNILTVTCPTCDRKYTLLEDATVVTWERTAARFAFQSGAGGSSPDLISPVDPRIVEQNYELQLEEVKRIRNSTGNRSWTCGVCRNTYRY